MKAQREKLPPRALDPSDVWFAKTEEKAAREMAKWLKGSVQLQKPIATLSLAQMTTLAAVAIGTFIVAASHRVHEDIEPEEHKQLSVLLS